MSCCDKKPRLYHKKHFDKPLSPEVLLSLMEAILGRDLPFRFRAGGFSMLPFIRDGDIITVSPMKTGYISTGDVVAARFASKNKVLVHRVVKITDNSFLLRGDNCLKNDGIVSCPNILGKVTKIERRGKEKRFGFGPERFLIAVLSRSRCLFVTFFILRKLFSFFKNP